MSLNLHDPRGTNVWPTVSRVRMDLAISLQIPDEQAAIDSVGLECWYGIVANISPQLDDAIPPVEHNPFLTPSDNEFMDIGMLQPHYVAAGTGTTFAAHWISHFTPMGPIDTRAMRRFDEPDNFITTWLNLDFRDRFGNEPTNFTSHVQLVASTTFLQAGG